MGMVPQTGIFVGYREWPEYDGDFWEVIDEVGEVGGYEMDVFGDSDYWGLIIREADEYSGFMEPVPLNAEFLNECSLAGAKLDGFLSALGVKMECEQEVFVATFWG